jgi:hypothetical protein
MPHATSCTNLIATIGIDIGKNTFHVIGLDDKGAIISRHKLTRGQVYARLANIPPCLIGMEACVGAHHLGRHLSAFGGKSPFAQGLRGGLRGLELLPMPPIILLHYVLRRLGPNLGPDFTCYVTADCTRKALPL